MENQHRLIKGYRELSEVEIAVVNAIKLAGTELGEIVDGVRQLPDVDGRWVSIAQTHLQQGIMALIRAVTRPEGF